MKTEWIKGIPTDPGVYWFDTGTGLGPKPLVLRVFSEGIPYFYGDGGSGPLDVIIPRMKHAIISPPTTWGEKISPRTWIRHPEGYLGFGIFRNIDNGVHEAYGTLIWFDHPNQGVTHCGRYTGNEKYLYCNVKEAMIP